MTPSDKMYNHALQGRATCLVILSASWAREFQVYAFYK